MKDIAWADVTESLPALVTALAIPLTFSIAEGIGMGFIAYAAIKLLSGRVKEIGPGVALIAAAFAAKIAFG
jgi:AGZA family xanthine/uracil permease-like MFS transporter